jgi:hypothetical protein
VDCGLLACDNVQVDPDVLEERIASTLRVKVKAIHSSKTSVITDNTTLRH